MFIGYARVSTNDQALKAQIDELKKKKCDPIFTDIASGVSEERPGLDKALAYLRKGDTLVVYKLDRLGRSLRHLIDTVNTLSERGTSFISISESLDTSTSGGRLIFHVFGALAEFERELIVERTQAGLIAARARGRNGGRPKKLDNEKLKIAKDLMSNPANGIKDICKSLQISRSTLYRNIANESQTNKAPNQDAKH